MSLLLQITLFLAAALMIVPLAKRLGIATVLGYLFTGILPGSYKHLTVPTTCIVYICVHPL